MRRWPPLLLLLRGWGDLQGGLLPGRRGRGASPHGWGGPGGWGPPFQAQVTVDRAVCRRDVRAQSRVVEREERHGSLHCGGEGRGGRLGSRLLLTPPLPPATANPFLQTPGHSQSHPLRSHRHTGGILAKKPNQVRTQTQYSILFLSKPLDPMTSLYTIQGTEKKVEHSVGKEPPQFS